MAAAVEAREPGLGGRTPLISLQSRRPPAGATTVQLFRADASRCNRIRTNKYTWCSFVPVNLFEQFSQLGNAYFLLVALLQMIPAISNTEGKPMTLVPLSFVVFMGAVKDAFEDLQRFLSDRRENLGGAIVVDRDLRETMVHWEDIRPGMVILVQEGERLPVDALVLTSDLQDGECFVETSNLDGESNLKKKVAALSPGEWQELCAAAREDSPSLSLEVEPPSVDLHKFNGAMQILGESEPRGTHIGNVLLRGTSLQRTGRVYCLAVYCGSETRAMQNSQSARFKASKLDMELNGVVLTIFALQFAICSTLSLCSVAWRQFPSSKAAWYLDLSGDDVHSLLVTLVIRAGVWLLQTNSMVPVSLIVTLTGVKFVQGMFIAWDRQCGDFGGGKPAKVNTSQVIESLGQVTHVFSDKTGTLTQNLMEYKACSVAGRIYGLEGEQEQPQQPVDASAPGGSFSLWSLQEHAEEGRAAGSSPSSGQGLQPTPHVSFRADAFRHDLGAAEDPSRQAALASFLLCHALCHSVEVEGGEGQSLRGSRASLRGAAPLYNGMSPDELALVYMAHAMGLEFVRMSEGKATLRVHDATLATAVEAACGWSGSKTEDAPRAGQLGAALVVDVLDVCEFDNDRKRSSMVVRYPDGRLVLLLKGADSSVLPYISSGVSLCEEHLSNFAQRGLRTLCLASRSLSTEEHAAWHARYAQAQALVSSDRAEQVQSLAEELETCRPLELLGSTAIEDRLQDNVPETIEQLRSAGICVWVLTGDKVETAISIARSCKLLTEDMRNILVEDPSPAAVEKDLGLALCCDRPALTVAGAALTTALATEERQLRFLEAAVRCRSVVCCRVSPKQKADVVNLVKDHKASATALSIGDGANDVSMIVAAHVGVGISGKEGAQAAYTADFAISEFRYLRRLLFVHGRESYRRTSVVIFYNFYKNMLLVAPTLLFAPLSGFTGQNLFFPWLCQLYNVFYTHLAVCVYGIMDRQTADLDDLEVEPRGYAPRLFSSPRAFVWIVAAVVQAAVISGFCSNALDGGRVSGDGWSLGDLQTAGYFCFLCVVVCANTTMALRQSSWFGFMWLIYGVNIGTACASVWIFTPATIHALFGSNMPRVLLTGVLIIVTTSIIGEAIIRHSGLMEELILQSHRREEAPEAAPEGARELSPPAPSAPASSPFEVEMTATTSSVLTPEEAAEVTDSKDVAGVPPACRSFGSRISGSSHSMARGTAERAQHSSGYLGYAFAQECAVERASVCTPRQSLSSST